MGQSSTCALILYAGPKNITTNGKKNPYNIDFISTIFSMIFLVILGFFPLYSKFEYLKGQSSTCALTIIASRISGSTTCVEALR